MLVSSAEVERGSREPSRVSVVEVVPRDGFQSHPAFIRTDTKIRLIELLADSGLRKIEVTGLARTDVIPQLADGEQVLEGLRRRPGVVYRALCPNLRGAERAISADANELLTLVTVSETYSRKNTNMSVEDALAQVGTIAALAAAEKVPVTVAIGVCTFCPYEGKIPLPRVVEVLERVHDAGVRDCYLSTSAGLDGPGTITRLLDTVQSEGPDIHVGLHLHDTNGMAPANVVAALAAGVDTFESSICGLGGGIRMPAWMPHCGNMATEDLVDLLDDLQIDCGLDPDTVLATAVKAREMLELETTWSRSLAGTPPSAPAAPTIA